MKTTVLAIAVATLMHGVAPAAEQPVNVWTPLGDGTFELPKAGYPDMTGPALCWLPDRDFGVIAPTLGHNERNTPGVRKISFDTPQWTFTPGTIPDGLVPNPMGSPKAYVYLPELKKLLFLKQEWSHSKKRGHPVAGWLMDPVDATWEPISDPLSMSDASGDFNPSPGKDGLRLPVWGTLCYDAHRREAVAFGGGGIWGRVGAQKEPVSPGAWIFDETAKRVRRLLPEDQGIVEARRWFPGHAGTWLFSETEKTWRALEQPLSQQPAARILPGMAYDANANKIVLFGGDDLARCLNDTWLYDSASRTWERIETATAPVARAGHAMVYVPGQKAVLLAGGYAGGWKPLRDVWVFETEKGEWSQLDIDLPAPAAYADADYDPKRGLVVLASYPNTRRNQAVPVFTLKLDLASIGRLQPEPTDPLMVYHSKANRRPVPLPHEWLQGEGAPEDPNKVRAELKALPANEWKHLKPPHVARERNWGSYVYDVRTHRAYAWGGGHSAYAGAEISEFHLLLNRWRDMDDPTNYNPIWLHGMVGGPPGVSFGGWSLLPSHARKSYGVDPLSDSVITFAGDVYSARHHRFIGNIGECPGQYGFATQVAFVTAPHGLYAYSAGRGGGRLVRADWAGGGWEDIAEGGPTKHHENNFLVHDSKRDRLLYFYREGAHIWAFDFATRTWTEEMPSGPTPPRIFGDATYVPTLDAVLMVFSDTKDEPEKLYIYKCDERAWHTAPSAGDAFAGANRTGRDWSPHYDPELGLVVRVTPSGFNQWINVHVMRLDPANLELTAWK